MCIDTPSCTTVPEYYKVITKLSDPQYCNQLLEIIDHKISQTEQKTDLLLEKAEIYRRLGQIEESISTLKILKEQSPTNPQVKRLLNALEPMEGTKTTTSKIFTPTPFIQLKHCFGEETIDGLLQYVDKNKNAFKQAGIGTNGTIDPNKRKTLYLENLGKFHGIFQKQIEKDYANVAKRFGISAFSPSRIEYKITNHSDNHFFNVHRDDGFPGNQSDQRVISFVFYFYLNPKHFTGGDLLFFDTDSSESRYRNYLFTRILCERNCLTYFPSKYFHCVDVVNQKSDNFLNGRFAVTGHIRRNLEEYDL